MPRRTLPHRFLSTATFVAVAMTLLVPAIAHASTTTLSNVGEFTGIDEFPFGDPNTATYGEVITVPSGQDMLKGFTFYLEEPTGLIFRPYIFEWNGTQAVGSALYEGSNLHTESDASGVYEPVHVTTPGVPVKEGQQYVVFFSTSKNEAEDKGTRLSGAWGRVNSESFGSGVYINNGFNPNHWTEPMGSLSPEEVAENDEPEWQRMGGSFEMSLEYGQEPPVVTGVSPTAVSPGTTVTITGSELGPATQVMFGSTPAASFTVESNEQITAVAPSGPTGTVDVTVVDNAGTSATSAADRVTYSAPASSPPASSPPPSTAGAAAAKPAVAIALVAGTVKDGKAQVTLRCTGAACRGKLSLAWVHGHVTTLFSRTDYALSAGKSAVFTVALRREALRRLEQHHRLDIRVRATVEGGATVHTFTPLQLVA